MGAPMAWDPCLVPIEHLEMPGPPRIRVVEILATGTNGGAQEHLFSLMSRLDTAHYDASVVALSAGSAVRKMERNGIAVTVIDEPDDGEAVRALTVHLALIQPDVVHTHMYRADVVGTKAVMALAAGGHRRPYVVSTVHSSRVRSAEDRELIRQLTPQMDQLIAVSKSIEKKIADEHRTGAPVRLIYNGVDLQQYDHQEPCCTLRDEYGMEPGSQIVGVVARLEPEKGHQTLIEAWPNVLRECPDAYLLIVGEGSRRDFLEQWAAAHKVAHRVIFTGRRDDVPAVTAALDVAVLPSWREAQGLSECARGGDRPTAQGPRVRRPDRPGRPRPRPRALLRRADGQGDRGDLRPGRPGRSPGGVGRELSPRPGPSWWCGSAPPASSIRG